MMNTTHLRNPQPLPGIDKVRIIYVVVHCDFLIRRSELMRNSGQCIAALDYIPQRLCCRVLLIDQFLHRAVSITKLFLALVTVSKLAAYHHFRKLLVGIIRKAFPDFLFGFWRCDLLPVLYDIGIPCVTVALEHIKVKVAAPAVKPAAARPLPHDVFVPPFHRRLLPGTSHVVVAVSNIITVSGNP